jgi:Inner membrane protein YgaP-like, transmembrane domain
MGFSKFMASSIGRVARIVAGIAMITIGGLLGGGWWALSVVGLVPLVTGAGDMCLFNSLFHQPMSGKTVRAS